MIVPINKNQKIFVPSLFMEKNGLKSGSLIRIEQKGDRLVITPVRGTSRKKDNSTLKKAFEDAKNFKPKYDLTAEEMDEMNENGVLR